MSVGQCVFYGYSLAALIGKAYSVGVLATATGRIIPEGLIIGGPAWVESSRFEVQAKTDSQRPPTEAELLRMLQLLLKDRFRLVLHTENKEVPGYQLVLNKGGPKMSPSGGVEESPLRVRLGRQSQLTGSGTMKDLIEVLSNVLKAPVEDNTNLEGHFHLSLTWAPDELTGSRDLPDPLGGPSIMTALREQLGLGLQARRVRGSVLVIDRVEVLRPN